MATAEQKNLIKKIAFIAIALIAVIAACFFIFHGYSNTTTRQGDAGDKDSRTLSCSASAINNDGLFDATGAISSQYTIEAIFYDNHFDNLTLTYTGNFPDAAAANQAKDRIRATYYTSIQNRGFHPENDFRDAYTVYDTTKVQFRSYLAAKKLDSASAPLFLIDPDGHYTNRHTPDTLADFKQNYQAKGFTCTEKE